MSLYVRPDKRAILARIVRFDNTMWLSYYRAGNEGTKGVSIALRRFMCQGFAPFEMQDVQAALIRDGFTDCTVGDETHWFSRFPASWTGRKIVSSPCIQLNGQIADNLIPLVSGQIPD